MKYLPALLALFFITSTSKSQTRPPSNRPIIFDDFNYSCERNCPSNALRGRNDWYDLDGNVTRTSTRAWYTSNFNDSPDYETDTSSVVSAGSRAKINLYSNFTTRWSPPTPGDTSYAPPVLLLGMGATNGTWVSRIYLDDLPNGDSAFSATQGMMLKSDYWDSNPDGSHARWFEINHEWQNFFQYIYYPSYVPYSIGYKNPNDANYTHLWNMIVNGSILDDFEVTGNLATGGTTMSAPGSSSPLSCDHSQNSVYLGVIQDAVTCMSKFIGSNPYNFVDLMIQKTDTQIKWSAVAWNWQSGWNGADYYYMERILPTNNYPSLPMYYHAISSGTAERSWDNVKTRYNVQDTISYETEWFYYTPSTNLSVWDVANDVWWMQSNNKTRINTNGINTERTPSNNESLTVHSINNGVYRMFAQTDREPAGAIKINWSIYTPMTGGGWKKIGWSYDSGFVYDWNKSAPNDKICVTISNYYGNENSNTMCYPDFEMISQESTNSEDIDPNTIIVMRNINNNTIRINTSNHVDIKFDVFDITGRNVYSINQDVNGLLDLRLPSFGYGVYLVRAKSIGYEKTMSILIR